MAKPSTPDRPDGSLFDPAANREAEFARRTAMLSAISYAATALLSNHDWESLLSDLIARLGQATGVSRVVLFQVRQLDSGQLAQTCRFEWAAEGVAGIKNDPANQDEILTATDASGEQWLQRRQRGEITQVLVRQLDGYMRAKFSTEGILSMVTVPIMVKGQLWGHIDFDDCQQERIWSEVEIDALKTLASLLGAIVERVRLDAELRASEQRFRSIAEALPVVICDYEDCEVLYASPPAAEMLGRSPAEMLGVNISGFHADPNECYSVMKKFAEHGAIDDTDVTYKRADNSLLPATVTARRIDYAGQQAIISAITDLSARKAAEAELERQRAALHQADKMSALGSLLAGVSHELNNPLAVVVGQAAMLEQEYGGSTRLGQRAGKIRSAAERCVRIVKTFLAMARQRPPERSEIHLGQVIDAVLDLTAYGIRANDIKVDCVLDPDLPTLWGDSDQLSQVVLNLLINAQQALQDVQGARRLHINTRFNPAKQRIVLDVIDNGPGVPPENRQRIFEPFFTTKPVGMGTGIGLSLCQSIVSNHGGAISVSEAPEGGALFRLELPVGEAAVADKPAPEQPTTTDGRNTQATILIVDDEREIAELLAEILQNSGYQTRLAHSGRAALQQLAKQPVDLILSDIRMPDLDGLGFYKVLVSDYPQMLQRLIFITGDVLRNADYLALRETIPMLEKPFAPQQVTDLVASRLAALQE